MFKTSKLVRYYELINFHSGIIVAYFHLYDRRIDSSFESLSVYDGDKSYNFQFETYLHGGTHDELIVGEELNMNGEYNEIIGINTEPWLSEGNYEVLTQRDKDVFTVYFIPELIKSLAQCAITNTNPLIC